MVLTVGVVWKLPRVYGVFTLVTLLALLSANHFQSMTRWALTVFPIFFLVAIWGRNRWLNYAVIGVSFVIALFFMARFAQWQWLA